MIGVPVGCLGAADRNLGVLASTLRRWDDAERHFEAALMMNTRTDGRPWVALTQRDYAQMLFARGRRGDRERARQYLSACLELAQLLGSAAIHWKAAAAMKSLSQAG